MQDVTAFQEAVLLPTVNAKPPGRKGGRPNAQHEQDDHAQERPPRKGDKGKYKGKGTGKQNTCSKLEAERKAASDFELDGLSFPERFARDACLCPRPARQQRTRMDVRLPRFSRAKTPPDAQARWLTDSRQLAPGTPDYMASRLLTMLVLASFNAPAGRPGRKSSGFANRLETPASS